MYGGWVRSHAAGSKFGLPFLPPSKSTTADFKKGANMAITGATAMDAPFFHELRRQASSYLTGKIRSARLALTDVTPTQL